MITFTDAEVRLAESLPNYESRPQQQLMASTVEAAIASGRHLVVQAGCGTGKSLAYLITSVLSGKRTVVSTATKALQDQIANLDLPFLAEHLGVSFNYAILKGRSNYLCVNKARTVDGSQVRSLAAILERAVTDGFNGEREDLGFEVSAADWIQVCADTDDCAAYGCKDDPENCFAQRARERAMHADVVVVNHALYFTDMMVRQVTDGFAALLPEHAVVVFDEAHEIEEYASNVLGAQFTEIGIRMLSTEIRNWAHRVADPDADAAFEASTRAVDAAAALWSVLELNRIRQATLLEHEAEWTELALALQAIPPALAHVDMEYVSTADVSVLRKQRDRLFRRAAGMARRFTDIVVADFADLVRWVEEETTRRGEVRKVLRSAPVNVGKLLREWLFDADGGPTAILTSATVLVDGTANYLASRIGLDLADTDVLDVGTPFDFGSQSVLYVPENMVTPDRKNRNVWEAMAIAEIGELVRHSDGRALLLFTSNAQMRATYNALAPTLGFTCLMQGQAPNKELARQFMDDRHSVLFATRSFFTGVDFRGEACSLVVMDKLPFPVPDEPVTEARCDAIRAAGGNEFMDYTVPVMSLVLQQGFGRLIRHRDDTGVVAILDSRLLSKPYGKTILRSLPPARRITKQQEVQEAFTRFATRTEATAS